jgi:hypothetical protein
VKADISLRAERMLTELAMQFLKFAREIYPSALLVRIERIKERTICCVIGWVLAETKFDNGGDTPRHDEEGIQVGIERLLPTGVVGLQYCGHMGPIGFEHARHFQIKEISVLKFQADTSPQVIVHVRHQVCLCHADLDQYAIGGPNDTSSLFGHVRCFMRDGLTYGQIIFEYDRSLRRKSRHGLGEIVALMQKSAVYTSLAVVQIFIPRNVGD